MILDTITREVAKAFSRRAVIADTHCRQSSRRRAHARVVITLLLHNAQGGASNSIVRSASRVSSAPGSTNLRTRKSAGARWLIRERMRSSVHFRVVDVSVVDFWFQFLFYLYFFFWLEFNARPITSRRKRCSSLITSAVHHYPGPRVIIVRPADCTWVGGGVGILISGLPDTPYVLSAPRANDARLSYAKISVTRMTIVPPAGRDADVHGIRLPRKNARSTGSRTAVFPVNSATNDVVNSPCPSRNHVIK